MENLNDKVLFKFSSFLVFKSKTKTGLQLNKKKSDNKESFISDFAFQNNFTISLVKRAVNLHGTCDSDKIMEYCLANDTDLSINLNESIQQMDIEAH